MTTIRPTGFKESRVRSPSLAGCLLVGACLLPVIAWTAEPVPAAAAAPPPAPKTIGEYTLYNGGEASVEGDVIKLKGPGQGAGANVLVRKLPAANRIVTWKARVAQDGGKFRTILLALGTSAESGTFVTGGARWGLNKITIFQYGPASLAEPVDHRDRNVTDLPPAAGGVDVTLSVDLDQKNATLTVGAGKPLTWPLKVQMSGIDLVGFSVEGGTQAAFSASTVTTGAGAAAPAAK